MKIMETAEKYVYTQYAALGEANSTTRYELIDGVVYFMVPGPSQAHQTISRKLLLQFAHFLDGKPCEVFNAPFDVCLNAKGDDDSTVVQPDLLVVCDESKLDGKRCNGAPDLIIEILSPSNRKYDMVKKFHRYLWAGVREYWIVDPEDQTVTVHILKNKEYTANVYSVNDDDLENDVKIDSVVPVHVLDGCEIDLKKVFSK